jgi:hypothetical protein
MKNLGMRFSKTKSNVNFLCDEPYRYTGTGKLGGVGVLASQLNPPGKPLS